MNYFPEHLLGIRHLDKEDLDEIFRVTGLYKKQIVRKISPERILSSKSAVNLFFEDSTRTKTSFELVEKKLGLDVVNFTESGSSLSKGESLLDTIKNIESMKFDYIVVRHSVPGTALLLTKHTTSRIINAGDGTNEHPTQGLLDLFTLTENFGSLKNLNICIVGDISHSRVALSNIFGLKKMGANVSVCGPVSFIPKYIEGLGVNVITDINEAVKKSDVLNILRVQLERNAGSLLPSLKEYNKHYGITKDRLSLNKKVKVLHPGPMNINVELDSFVSVSEQSLIFDQVTNGVAVKCAVFNLMSGKK
ncbi:MAG TPA: aspartate carbamoyltransferase catalytic subunit [Ignavibacteria bacterium]|mgnify:CR=1 FL=1|nr:aspartate carbamoyltransferase catalytic subunit [Ignavibacteria bacterium]